MAKMAWEPLGAAGLAAILIFGGLGVLLHALRPFPLLALTLACIVGGLAAILGFRLGHAVPKRRLNP